MTSTGLTPSGSVSRSRHIRDMALAIDLAFSEFERRTYECLSEAQEKIVREAETAHEYCMLQLSQLRNSILKSLSDYEKQSEAATNVHHKRARSIEDRPAGRRKKAKYSIADAWDDINAEAKKNVQKLAAKKNIGTAAKKGRDYEEILEEQSDEEDNESEGEEESGSGSEEESGSGSEEDGGSGSEEDGASEGAEEGEFEDEEVESGGSARGEESG